MANEANIKAVITAEDKASSVLAGFGNHVNSVAGKVGDALKVAAEGLAIGGAAATAFGVASVKAFTESQDMIAQTNAVLKSTGGIAGVTADQVTKLATALQKTTKFSDEDVRSAENLLLTFTAIGKDIFPQATTTVLDMATALGEDTKSASIQLGKALQDPVLGITALRRVGVNFSDKQKDVIQKLVDTNKKAEAQKLILKELQTEFGGSAEAAGNTFAGSLAKLKNKFNDVQEVIGGTIANYLTPFISKAADALGKIDWEAVINNTIAALKDFWRELQNVWQNIDRIYQQIEKYLQPKLVALKNTIMDDLLPALRNLWDAGLGTLVKKLGVGVGEGLVWALGLVIDTITTFITAFSGIVDWISKNKWAFDLLIGLFGTLAAVMAFNGIVAAFNAAMLTITTVTIPAIAASWSGLIALLTGPIVIPALVVTAAVMSIYSIRDAWNAVLNSASAAASMENDAQIIQLQKQAAAARATGDTKKVNQIANAIAALGGGRAAGGPVTGGVPYLVGEMGPEVVVPNQSGTVIPNNKLGGLGSNVTIQINAGIFMGNDIEARKTAQYIFSHLKDLAASKNQTVAQMMGM